MTAAIPGKPLLQTDEPISTGWWLPAFSQANARRRLVIAKLIYFILLPSAYYRRETLYCEVTRLYLSFTCAAITPVP